MELHFEPVAEGSGGPSSDAPPVTVDYDLFSHPADKHRFAVGLRVVTSMKVPETSDADSLAMSVRARAVGFFSSATELPVALPIPVAANGLAILYGIMRGVINTASGWFDASEILPTVSFSRMLRERTREAESAGPAPEPSNSPRKRRPKRSALAE